MNFDHVFTSRSLMQSVDVLRDDHDATLLMRTGKRGHREMRRIRLSFGHHGRKLPMRSKTPARITTYRGCRRPRLDVDFVPQSAWTTKRPNARSNGYTSSRQKRHARTWGNVELPSHTGIQSPRETKTSIES